MKTVFISGSMHIKKLDDNVQYRLNNIMDSGLSVLVGDADGVDTSIQNYLHANNFDSVVVYCSGNRPRNNVGGWIVREVKTNHKPGTRAFYTAKDVEMARTADFGFMIWDTKSTGTLSNIFELLSLGKKSLVYINKNKEFFKVSSVYEVESLLSIMSIGAFQLAEQKIEIPKRLSAMKTKQLSWLT